MNAAPIRLVKFKTGKWWHIVSERNLTACGLVVGFRDPTRTVLALPDDVCAFCEEAAS